MNHFSLKNTLVVIALSALTSLGCAKDEPKSEVSKTPTKIEAPIANKAVTAPGATTPSASNSITEQKAKGKYEFDLAHTQVLFQVEHFGVSTLTGMFRNLSGGFVLDADPSKMTVEVEIDAASIFTADQKRDDHLKSPDFFDVKQFPKLTFKSSSVVAQGENTYNVTGDLTIHGIKKTVTIPFTHNGSKELPKQMGGAFISGFSGKLTVDRHDFGVSYGKGVLGDEITISISLEGKRI